MSARAFDPAPSWVAAPRFLALVVVSLLALGAQARASVSVSVTFDDLLRRASAVAVVVPEEQRSVWEDGRIVSYTHVRVGRLMAGRLSGEVWVRTFGGVLGGIAQLVEGEATFTQGGASLVFLHPRGEAGSPGIFAVVEGAQGQFGLETGDGQQRLTEARGVGALLPPPGAPRLARDMLLGRSLEDAARQIGAAWLQFHSKGEAR